MESFPTSVSHKTIEPADCFTFDEVVNGDAFDRREYNSITFNAAYFGADGLYCEKHGLIKYGHAPKLVDVRNRTSPPSIYHDLVHDNKPNSFVAEGTLVFFKPGLYHHIALKDGGTITYVMISEVDDEGFITVKTVLGVPVQVSRDTIAAIY